VAVAVNCWVVPTATLAPDGVTEIDVSVTVPIPVTFSDAFPLIPLSVAVTMVGPEDTPVARPVELVVATDAGVFDQIAVALTLHVEPSL
jgi:hypothetical protein